MNTYTGVMDYVHYGYGSIPEHFVNFFDDSWLTSVFREAFAVTHVPSSLSETHDSNYFIHFKIKLTDIIRRFDVNCNY